MRTLSKFLLAALLYFLVALALPAQSTIVTGTVADANGNPYANGTVSAAIQLASGQPLPPGALQSSGPFTMTGSGTFSISLIGPFSYIFTFCGFSVNLGPLANPGPVTVCFQTPPILVSGGAIDITASLGTVTLLGPRVAGNNTGAQTNIANNFTQIQTFSSDIINRGPGNPSGVDLRFFNIRPINSAVIPKPLCTINVGVSANTLNCNSSSGFIKNDAIAVTGAGPVNSVTTPAAPTVTPSCSSGPPGTGFAIPVAGGGSTYTYSYATRDIGEGLTAASPQTTTNTGFATLGARSQANTSIVPGIANTFTITMASSAELAPGCMIVITGTTDDAEYGGPKIVLAVPDGTHATFGSGMDASISPGLTNATATGGAIKYWLCNHIVMAAPAAGGHQHIVYGRSAGSMTFLDVTTISSLGYTDPTYNALDDFGSPMMDGRPVPWWLTVLTPPGAATNDTFSSVITNIAGNVLTTATNATNNVNNALSQFDIVPNLAAAISQVETLGTGGGGALHFPAILSVTGAAPNCYPISTFANVAVRSIFADGALCLYDTLKLSGFMHGSPSDSVRLLAPSFALGFRTPIFLNGANPGIWSNGGAVDNLYVDLSGNGGIGVFNTGSSNARVYFNDTFASNGGSGDLMSIPLYDYENSLTGGGFGFKMRDSSVLTGPVGGAVGSTYTPAFVGKYGTLYDMDYISGQVRGLYFAPPFSGLSCAIHIGEEFQGPITPILMFQASSAGNTSGFCDISSVLNDTGPAPLMANLSSASTTLGANFVVRATNLPSSAEPLISGQKFANIFLSGINITSNLPLQIGQNTNICMIGGSNGFNNGINCSNFFLGSMFLSRTAPTVSSGFGTTPLIVNANGTAFFQVNVGTGGVATAGVVGLPAAAHNWNCTVQNLTAHAGNRADDTVQTASTTTTVTVQNQTKSTGAALAWTASDVLQLSCMAN